MVEDYKASQPLLVSRRKVLAYGGLAAIAPAIGSLGNFVGSAHAVESGLEAPMLAEAVAAGNLPPLSERLPAVPCVVTPRETAGAYGGTWRSAILGPGDFSWIEESVSFDALATVDLQPDGQFTAPYASIAQSIDISPDGKVFTFTLRRGMKWSDGAPFTADDVVFGVNDVLLNKALFPSPNEALVSGGKVARVEKVDDHTVRFSFDVPAAFFLAKVATSKAELQLPSHFLRTLHADYNAEADADAKAKGFDSWASRILGYVTTKDKFSTTERPTLDPWRVVEPLGGGQRVLLERNPYYWKVDQDGRQLPYLDRVEFAIVENSEVVMLKAINGEIDLHQRHINVLKNKPVLAQGRETGNYAFYDVLNGRNAEFTVQLNFTHATSPAMSEMFRNKDFRIGLSHAINRQEIINTVFQRQGTPAQVAQAPTSTYYNEQLEKQYIEYDVALANAQLDKAGYPMGADGFRVRPDGERVKFEMSVPIGLSDAWVPALEMIKTYWGAVGVDMTVNSMERSLWTTRVEANDFDATVWVGTECTDDAVYRPAYYLPFKATLGGGWSAYAIKWNEWYLSGGTKGEEPPDAVKEQLSLYDRVQTAANQDDLRRDFQRIIDIAADQFYVIGILRAGDGYGIVSKSFRNTPKAVMNAGFNPDGPGPSRPEQFYFSS
jgi:peptide/nickel transport system substrate-binding protein